MAKNSGLRTARQNAMKTNNHYLHIAHQPQMRYRLTVEPPTPRFPGEYFICELGPPDHRFDGVNAFSQK